MLVFIRSCFLFLVVLVGATGCINRTVCEPGSQDCPCYGNGTCDDGLACSAADVCEVSSSTETNNTSPTPPDPAEGGLVPLDDVDLDCLQVDLEDVRSYPDAAVRARFVLRHCNGWPIVRPLGDEDIRVINDNTGMSFNDSAEGGGSSAPARVDVRLVSTSLSAVLALDLSDSIIENGRRDQVLDAAQDFVDSLVRDADPNYRFEVALMVFGRSNATRVVQEFTSDHDALTAAIDLQRTNEGLGTTNLYGAYNAAIDLLQNRPTQADVVERTLLIMTDGRHEAGDFENQRANALSTRDRAREEEIKVYSIAIEAPADDRPFLAELATEPAFFDAAETVTELRESFEITSEYLRRLPEATYIVGICSPVELGEASLTIKVNLDGVESSATASYSTNVLNGDTTSCNPEEVADPCTGRECGPGVLEGFECGECELGECQAGMCACPEGLMLCAGVCDTPERCRPDGAKFVEGPFKSITVSDRLLCVLEDTGGRVRCIGCFGQECGAGEPLPADPSYVSLESYQSNVCALREDGSRQCYYEISSIGLIEVPADYSVFVVSKRCGLDSGGRLICIDDVPIDLEPFSTGTYKSIDIGTIGPGAIAACAVRMDGQMLCDGYRRMGVRNEQIDFSETYAGPWRSVHMGQASWAWLGSGSVVPWVDDFRGRAVSTNSDFVKVVAGFRACGLTTEGQVECWKAVGDGGTLPDPPAGIFNDIGVGSQVHCGIRLGGELACWGDKFAIEGLQTEML